MVIDANFRNVTKRSLSKRFCGLFQDSQLAQGMTWLCACSALCSILHNAQKGFHSGVRSFIWSREWNHHIPKCPRKEPRNHPKCPPILEPLIQSVTSFCWFDLSFPLLLPYFRPLMPWACTVSTVALLVVCTSNLSPSSSSTVLSKWSFRISNMTVTLQPRILLWFPNICTLYKTLYDDDAVQLSLLGILNYLSLSRSPMLFTCWCFCTCWCVCVKYPFSTCSPGNSFTFFETFFLPDRHRPLYPYIFSMPPL